MSDNKILFLDDEAEYVKTIGQFLENFGYKVILATTPSQALQSIRDDKPTFVFFDYKMPEMEGDAFFQQAKNIHKDAKYFLVSAYRNDATIEYFKKLGVTDVIMKPIDLSQFLEMLRRMDREG